tara:strand:- start:1687 stop:1896 length:210 start_codon:yes stop_codon:yes gene_type:complete
MIKGIKSRDVVGSLMLSSLKHNYVEFVDEWGYDRANQYLHELFGEAWLNNREVVWQWYDQEYKKGVANG